MRARRILGITRNRRAFIARSRWQKRQIAQECRKAVKTTLSVLDPILANLEARLADLERLEIEAELDSGDDGGFEVNG